MPSLYCRAGILTLPPVHSAEEILQYPYSLATTEDLERCKITNPRKATEGRLEPTVPMLFLLTYRLTGTLVYMDHVFIIRSSVERHLNYFYSLAIVNRAALNSAEQVSVGSDV